MCIFKISDVKSILGSKITDSSLGFLYSERILFQEISPLEFLYLKLDGSKETGGKDEVLEPNHSGKKIRFICILY